MAPVNRCQSPTSTARPKAVSVLTPRKHPSRPTTGANAEEAAICSMAPSSRPQRAWVLSTVSKASSKASCTPSRSKESERSQPSCSCVQAVPCHTRPWRSSSAESRCRARIRSPAHVLARSHQIPRGFLRLGGHPHGREFPDPQQPDRPLGIPPAGLDPVTRRPLDLGQGHHHAPHTHRRQRLPARTRSVRPHTPPPPDQATTPPRTPPRPPPAPAAATRSPPKPHRSRPRRPTGHEHPARHTYART
ncbi:hypothetical protein QFZ22_000969 [Streptomyces canus]|uniref:Uncharacterized protein n=1 Tax=Streptomyces canus TaxID=58343 RepID=A0AAW8F4B3_9ACTN|nr:hypothetical protein [Streptomyces canus]